MFSYRRAQGEGRVSGSVETVPPAAVCNRSVAARRAARLADTRGGAASRRPTGARDGRTPEQPIVGLSSRGVSVAGAAALEGLTGKYARRQMAPQGLEKVELAPGNGMAPAALDPLYLVERRRDCPSSSRRAKRRGDPESRRSPSPPGSLRFARDDDFQAARVSRLGRRKSPKVAQSAAQDVEIARAPIDIARHYPGSVPPRVESAAGTDFARKPLKSRARGQNCTDPQGSPTGDRE